MPLSLIFKDCLTILNLCVYSSFNSQLVFVCEPVYYHSCYIIWSLNYKGIKWLYSSVFLFGRSTECNGPSIKYYLRRNKLIVFSIIYIICIVFIYKHEEHGCEHLMNWQHTAQNENPMSTCIFYKRMLFCYYCQHYYEYMEMNTCFCRQVLILPDNN